jgi:hypothetical protein
VGHLALWHPCARQSVCIQNLASADQFKRIHPNPDVTEAGMDTPASYLDLGFIHISIPNLAVIVGMIVLFAIALFAPFPHGEEVDDVRSK